MRRYSLSLYRPSSLFVILSLSLPFYSLYNTQSCCPLSFPPFLRRQTYITISLSLRSVNDIDLWSAGVSERPLPGSMLGPIFSCIIATQFQRARKGDRYWYELPGQPSSFSPSKSISQWLIFLNTFISPTSLKTIFGVLRGAMVARSAHNREIPGSIPGWSGNFMGDFSQHPAPLPTQQ